MKLLRSLLHALKWFQRIKSFWLQMLIVALVVLVAALGAGVGGGTVGALLAAGLFLLMFGY